MEICGDYDTLLGNNVGSVEFTFDKKCFAFDYFVDKIHR